MSDELHALLLQRLIGALPEVSTPPNEVQQIPSPVPVPEMVTPLQPSGYSPSLTVGGRSGRFNFDLPREVGGTPSPRFGFETDDGGLWFYQLEKALQGGRWEDAEHAPEDYERYQQMSPIERQLLMEAVWGSDPIGTTIDESAEEGVSFEDLVERLQQFNTHRQISLGEPTPN